MSSGFASEFPTLARLALSDEHRQALRQGGFVALERRGAGKQVVKLRFRCGGRQHVRYLGASAEAGEQARRELERLQGDFAPGPGRPSAGAGGAEGALRGQAGIRAAAGPAGAGLSRLRDPSPPATASAGNAHRCRRNSCGLSCLAPANTSELHQRPRRTTRMYDDVTELAPDQPLGQEPELTEPLSGEETAALMRQARQQCVQNYLQHSLAQRNPLRAGFGAINADLMAVAQPIADLLKRVLSSPALSIDGAQKMMPVLETYHRITRMIERFGQLDVRIAAEGRNRKQSRRAVNKPRSARHGDEKDEDLAIGYPLRIGGDPILDGR